MATENLDPLLVIVHDGRYDCFGPPTPRNEFLVNLLYSVGGIANSVPDGKYHFNAVSVGSEHLVSLEPVE